MGLAVLVLKPENAALRRDPRMDSSSFKASFFSQLSFLNAVSLSALMHSYFKPQTITHCFRKRGLSKKKKSWPSVALFKCVLVDVRLFHRSSWKILGKARLICSAYHILSDLIRCASTCSQRIRCAGFKGPLNCEFICWSHYLEHFVSFQYRTVHWICPVWTVLLIWPVPYLQHSCWVNARKLCAYLSDNKACLSLCESLGFWGINGIFPLCSHNRIKVHYEQEATS